MIKSNKEEFIKKSKIKYGDKYDYSLVEYLDARTKVKIIYNGWIFHQSPDNHLRGKLCEKNWDLDRFIFESKKIHGDKYDYSLVDFKNMKTQVEIIFEGTIYKQTPSKHLMGRKVESWQKIKTNEEFIKDAIKIWGNKYDYSLVDYKGAHNPIDIIYKNKIYRQSPSSHLNLMKCERNTIKSEDEFLTKAISRHGNKYDYSITKYNGINNKIKFIFNDKIYEQKAGAHLYAGVVERRRNKKDTISFINEANIVHDFKYDYTKSTYLNYSSKLTITCQSHGDWQQGAGSHLQGHGCPNCTESNGEKLISKVLNKIDIKYYRQHRFKNINRLPFDFYISSLRTCIEFDGIQHFQPVEYFGGQTAYEKLKINDKIKSNYCEDNYIDLIRIRYDQIDKIEEILNNNLSEKLKLI